MSNRIWLAGVLTAATIGFASTSAVIAEEKSAEQLRQEQAARTCLSVEGNVQKRIDACTYLIDNSDQLILQNEAAKPQYMAVFHYNRAANHLEAENLPEALNDLNKSIEFNPDYATAYFMRGGLHKRLNNGSQSKEDFAKAAALEPDNKKYQDAAKGR